MKDEDKLQKFYPLNDKSETFKYLENSIKNKDLRLLVTLRRKDGKLCTIIHGSIDEIDGIDEGFTSQEDQYHLSIAFNPISKNF